MPEVRGSRSPAHHDYPNTRSPHAKGAGNTMTSTINQVWDEMNSSETAKTQVYASRVSRILRGSKQVARSVPGTRSGIQPSRRSQTAPFPGPKSTGSGPQASAPRQVCEDSPRQPQDDTGGVSIVAIGIHCWWCITHPASTI